MGKKKVQPPHIVQLKADKEEAKKNLENELFRLDNEIKKYWSTITMDYIKVGMKFDLPAYKNGHILVTNMTDKFVMYESVSTIMKHQFGTKRLGYSAFGKYIYNISPTLRRSVTIDKILEL